MIGPAHHRGGIVRDVDVLQRIGAEVVDEAAAHAEHLAVGVDRDVDRPVLVALLRGVGEMLAPVLDPFDRALEQLRRRHHRDVLRIDAKLRTEAAADIGRHHAQPALVDVEQRGQRSGTGRAPSGSMPRRSCFVGRGGIRRRCRGPRSDGRRRGAARAPRGTHARPCAKAASASPKFDLVGGDDVGVELAAHRRRAGVAALRQSATAGSDS